MLLRELFQFFFNVHSQIFALRNSRLGERNEGIVNMLWSEGDEGEVEGRLNGGKGIGMGTRRGLDGPARLFRPGRRSGWESKTASVILDLCVTLARQ